MNEAEVITNAFAMPLISPSYVEYSLEQVDIKGAWQGPAQLQLAHYALAPVANLPIRRRVSGIHLLTALTLWSCCSRLS
ncbi:MULTISPECIES: acetoacetate decarboxylase family protein [Legionella]|uniref:Acetoacetate decarboxylase family protein n=1 Tax=Legionella resiliens TaxID=2905958 RepID=A0ABS8WZF5_9GAMM|nr:MULTISPECIES: acetoacetate decarboxylase family protein [unclassified Legionella]MCE0722718.1 acetoacetate decarboxylase family protein [Legionella sp. 9fVS26]MCE3531871.1 acetoacetate decarboxylase family protein [Legionella sp. 8cVS16]QLZ67944.1 acetoacetate decarboxylase [Legionella sp. PC1000]